MRQNSETFCVRIGRNTTVVEKFCPCYSLFTVYYRISDYEQSVFDKKTFRMSQEQARQLMHHMDFLLWWTSSAGDQRTREASPETLRGLFNGLSTDFYGATEQLLIFSQILMEHLGSGEERFDSVGEWLDILGEHWSGETQRWRRELAVTMTNPRSLAVSCLVTRAGQLRGVIPRSAGDFGQMLENDAILIFRTAQQADYPGRNAL